MVLASKSGATEPSLRADIFLGASWVSTFCFLEEDSSTVPFVLESEGWSRFVEVVVSATEE